MCKINTSSSDISIDIIRTIDDQVDCSEDLGFLNIKDVDRHMLSDSQHSWS
jgi:hypothetical protein